jgi:hypothetical protein
VIDSQSPHFNWRKNTMSTEKKDVFQRVTDQILKAIEDGAGSYRMPWRTSGGFPSSPINAVTKRPYRGINVLILWALAQEKKIQIRDLGDVQTVAEPRRTGSQRREVGKRRFLEVL